MAILRFLGNTCIEVKTENNHYIIDPNYVKEPEKEIKQIFFTHITENSFDRDKVNRILEKANLDQNERIEIFGPNTLVDHISEMNPDILKEGERITFEEGFVEVYTADCFQVDKCFGYLISIDETLILHTATSSNFSAGLQNVESADYCFISCEENLFKNYKAYLEKLNPKVVIPYNYGPDKIEKPKKFIEHMEVHGINTMLLEAGNQLTI